MFSQQTWPWARLPSGRGGVPEWQALPSHASHGGSSGQSRRDVCEAAWMDLKSRTRGESSKDRQCQPHRRALHILREVTSRSGHVRPSRWVSSCAKKPRPTKWEKQTLTRAAYSKRVSPPRLHLAETPGRQRNGKAKAWKEAMATGCPGWRLFTWGSWSFLTNSGASCAVGRGCLGISMVSPTLRAGMK